MATNCRNFGATLEQLGGKFCPSCGTPVASELLVHRKDAVNEFAHPLILLAYGFVG